MRRRLKDLKVVALAGGVGGAKLVLGLDKVLAPGNLSVVVNTGDDFEHFGLKICPDLDTICYTLAGMANPTKGWGLKGESFKVQNALNELAAPGWFTLGDRDLATHLERTRLLKEGWTLSEVTHAFCNWWGIHSIIYPMCDSPTPTLIFTVNKRLLSFQEYFVREKCLPRIKSIIFNRETNYHPPKDLLNDIYEADLVVICPSNPFLSIEPILNFKKIKDLLIRKPVLAVSPIVGGMALKGPLAKIFEEFDMKPSSSAVFDLYKPFLNAFIYDETDEEVFDVSADDDIIIAQAQTIMKTTADKVKLAKRVLQIGMGLLKARNS